MFISGGENVYPAEVEGVLAIIPAVLEAAVIGVADARWGEVGHAAFVCAEAQTLEAAELRAFARTRLAAYKVPNTSPCWRIFPVRPPARYKNTSCAVHSAERASFRMHAPAGGGALLGRLRRRWRSLDDTRGKIARRDDFDHLEIL